MTKITWVFRHFREYIPRSEFLLARTPACMYSAVTAGYRHCKSTIKGGELHLAVAICSAVSSMTKRKGTNSSFSTVRLVEKVKDSMQCLL